MTNKEVNSVVQPLKILFAEKFDVDFYQREYVWQKKQVEDLINDLSTEFLRNWSENHSFDQISAYDPYYMGEVVLSVRKAEGRNAVIDGQQRITTLTLLLIYLIKNYESVDEFPKTDICQLIYSNYLGSKRFNLEIKERNNCMTALYETGIFEAREEDSISVKNLIDRYNEISDCWNEDISDRNIVHFAYWIIEKVMFSKVWTNSDEFAYIIFETMNDRGLSLTQVEMLRSYLLANIDVNKRDKAIKDFDDVVKLLIDIKLHSKSKAEFEFFKIYFRGHFANDLSQKNPDSDFIKIGNKFHRWLSENNKRLHLHCSDDYIDFLDRITYFSKIYKKINELMEKRNANDYLYLIVNADYGFTLQPALILASVSYLDNTEVVEQKIRIVSEYLTKILTWRVWNHWVISQSSLESTIFELCKKLRGKSIEDIQKILMEESINLPKLENAPTLNQQNGRKLRVLLALVTEIVARNSDAPDYMLNKDEIEIEHIWSNHYEKHIDEFSNESEFANMRNNIGDLLVLPKSFNAAYGADPYEKKVKHYLEQNILAQSLNDQKYERNPGFLKFIGESRLAFKSYAQFKRDSILERAELYRNILEWNWQSQ